MKFITWLFSLATRAVLLAILLGVLGFLVMFAYFLLGRTWSTPVILSAGHERVIQMQRDWLERNLKAAELDGRVQALRRQLLETENSLAIARLAITAEANAIRMDAMQNDLEIEVVGGTIAMRANERRNAFDLLLRMGRLPNPEDNFKKGLVNRARLLTDMLASADLSIKVTALDAALAEDAARLTALKRRRDSLRSAQAVLRGEAGEQLSHQEFEYVRIWSKATLDLQTSSGGVQQLRQTLSQLEVLHAELTRSLRPLAGNPLVAAAHEPATVVFVPYGNAAAYRPGELIYRCSLGLVLCFPVGTIGSLVDGEITLPHPFFQRAVRGGFHNVELMGGKQAAQDAILFSTRPLLF